MASSFRSKCKAKYIGPCFYDYLDGLREEFELSLAKNPRPRRFATYLDGLKFEFELMTEDIESVSKERDEFKVKVQAPNDFVCQRCSKETLGTSRNIASTPLKTLESASASPSRLVIQPKSLGKLNTSSPVNLSRNTHSRNMSSSPLKNSKATFSPSTVTGARSRPLQKPNISSRVVKPPHQTLRSPTQRVTIPQRTQSTATSMTASVSDTYSVSQPLEPMDAHPETVTLPLPLPQTPACPTTSFGNELRVGMAHAISHKEAILCVNFSQDGKYLAAGCQDGKSYIYDVETATLIQVLRDLLVEKDVIVTVRFSRDGKYLATGSSSGRIYVWKINTKYVRNAFKGYTSWIRSLDFSPNGRVVVSTSDSFVRLWNMRDGAAKDLTDSNISSYYSSAVFSPSGEYVAASHRDGMVRVWHVCTGQLMRRVKAHKDIAFDVGFTPDGKGLVSGGGDNSLKYWDISPWIATFVSGRSQTSDLDRRVCAPEEEILPEREYSGQLHAGRSLAISPDGRWVASASVDALVGIWDTRSGVMQYNLNHYDCVYSVDFSPAGDYLASSEYDGTVKIWRYAHIAPGGIQGHP